MAVAAYTTDLTDIADLDTTGGTAVEPNSLYTAGRSPIEDDEDFPIQGTVHASLTQNATGKGGILVPGNSWTYTSGEYIFGWIIWLAPSTIATQANGGLCMLLGSSSSVFNVYYVGGSDYGAYPYGGWQNFVVDPERTPDENAGTPTAYHYVGAGANCISKVSKGNPLGFDVFRYGRGEARITGGTLTDDDATFAGLAAVNDNNNNRWGLFQKIEGGYKYKGKLVIGYGAACNFTDSDVNIVIDNTEMVDSDFNRIEITTASSVINWTNVSFTALGTVSKGQLEMMDNATFNDTGGVFTDMDTFIYDTNADITSRTFRRCGQVTQGGGTFTSCIFEESTAAVAMLVSNLAVVTKNTFVSNGTGHAVNLGTISSTQSVSWDNYESGYASSDGSTGNETILVNVGSGYTLTINVATGASVPTIYNTGAGTVNVVAGTVTTKVIVKDSTTKTPIQDVAVTLKAKTAGPLPFEDTVTITRSGNTATVSHTAHGFSTGQKVEIKGAVQNEYNRIKTVTYIDDDSYSYTVLGSPTTPATGTIKATAIIIDGVTDSNGEISDSRTLSADQDVIGKAQKGSTPPVYKPQNIDTTINSGNGVTISLLLIED